MSGHGRGPKIVAGRFRGRTLSVARGSVTRPARVRVRRSLFDRLQGRVEDTSWLDLFSGSGSLGIEASSRGAARVTFVESSREPLRVLERNLEVLGLREPEALLVPARLPDWLQGPPPTSAPFDFLTMDPPFELSRDPRALHQLCESLGAAGRNGWWSPGAELYWEEPARAPRPDPPGFVTIGEVDFNRSRLRILEWSQEQLERTAGPADLVTGWNRPGPLQP